MAIKRLSNNLVPAFPPLGELRKGAPKGANSPGKDLTYWRFTSTRPEVQAAFAKIYGEKPARLDVYLPHAAVEANFADWCEEWSASSLVHRCDGETMTRWKDNGGYSDEPSPCPYFSGEAKRSAKNPGCKPIGRLHVILPDLLKAGYVGYVVLLTTSINDIISVKSSLAATLEARGSNPLGLRGIMFTVWRQSVKISTPNADGTRARREKSLIKIVPSAEWFQAQLAQAREQSLAQLPETVAVEPVEAAPDDEDVVDGTAEEVDEWPEDEPPAPAPAMVSPAPPAVAPAPEQDVEPAQPYFYEHRAAIVKEMIKRQLTKAVQELLAQKWTAEASTRKEIMADIIAASRKQQTEAIMSDQSVPNRVPF